jgi:hypothetical protein
MANELTIDAQVSYADADGVTDGLSVAALEITLGVKLISHQKFSVATAEQAVNITGITTLGYAMLVNRDETNFVEVRVGTGGTKFCKLKAGEVALFRFGSGITAPFIIADTAACLVEMMLFNN